MRTITYRLSDLNRVVIHIGYVAENKCTRVQIDAGEVYADYPDATAALAVKGPTGDPYPVVITRSGDTVIWDVLDSALTKAGMGEIQLTFTSGETVVKSCKGQIRIHSSIVGSGTVPEPIEDFLAAAGEALSEMEAYEGMTATATTLAAGESATAEIREVEGHKDLLIGVPKGDKGDPGVSADVIDDTTTSADKAWSSSKTSTEIGTKYTKPSGGIPAEDLAGAVQTSLGKADAAYQKPGTGIPAADLASGVIPDPTSIIDDTAGDGATNKVWSADKSADEKTALLSQINGKYTKPQTGIPSSDMASAVQTSLGKADNAYQKPVSGIPSTDMASSVQTSLAKADTALQGTDVSSAVDDWLEENITNPDSPPLDRSLSSSSAAAPADMVGEIKSAISEHDSFLEPLGYTKTLYGNDKFVNGLWANGSWRSDGNYGKYRSVHKMIPVEECMVVADTTTYTNLTISVALYDSNSDFISSLKINGVSVMNSTDIQSGSFKIKMSDITATSASAVYMSVGIGKVSGSTYYDLPSDLELSIVQPSSAENIADRVATLESKMIGDEVYSNTDFVNGMYANGSWRSDGAYGQYRSVHELITLDDYTVIAETETYTNMVISVDLFDSSNNRLGKLVQNDTVIQNGKYVISKSTALATQANTAKISIGIGKVSGTTYYDLPSDLKLSVIKAAIPTVIIVDCNGGGDYKTITEAVNNAPDSSGNKVTIFIKPGVYDEHIYVGGDRYLSFAGENRETCVIRSHTGMYTDAPLWIDGNFTIENLTLQMLDDEAPNTWTPGTSQSDPTSMLPGYAIHIDGGSTASADSVYGYKLGAVRNCTLYSVAFPAIGAGLHANQKLVFDNCDFIRNTSAKYHNNQYQYYTNYSGAMIMHDSTHSGDTNQNLEIINCRFICNLGKSATFRFKYGSPENVKYAMIDNTFWCAETSSSIVDSDIQGSVLLGYSHGNNNTDFNA